MKDFVQPDFYIICGPTASGKSALALEVARAKNGVIVNADSMQIYKDLQIITASPSNLDKQKIEHRLYNYVPAETSFSVASFVEAASKEIKNIIALGKTPIVTGGTGMYINALLNGISHVPEIEPQYRHEAEEIISIQGIKGLYEKLLALDPQYGSKLQPNDTQRISRGYEVIRQTGKSLLYFQNIPAIKPLDDFAAQIYFISPERQLLYENCNNRFVQLVKEGGLEEVKAFYAKYPYITSGPTKALGVSELIAYINGKMALEQAINLAQTKTRHYAKRQITWFKHQLPDDAKNLCYDNMEQYQRIFGLIAN